MGQDIAAWVVVPIAALIAFTNGTSSDSDVSGAREPDVPIEITVTLNQPTEFSTDVEVTTAERRSRARQPRTEAFETRIFPVADLISGTLSSGPAFKDPTALLRHIKRATGRRNWRGAGEIEWLERRQLVRVHHRPEVVEQVDQFLRKLRNPGAGRLNVTVRLVEVAQGSDMIPAAGKCKVVSAAVSRRLWRSRKKPSSQDLSHQAQYLLHDRDIVYAWTSDALPIESSYRGLNAVVQIAPDGRGANIASLPFEGDEARVDWPVAPVGIGQTVVYGVPTLASDSDGQKTVLVLITIDAIEP